MTSTSTTSRTRADAVAHPTSLADYRARYVRLQAPGRPAGAAALPDAAPLHTFFADSAADDPDRRLLRGTVAAVLARADRVIEADARVWVRLLTILDRHRVNEKAELNCAVLSNLVGTAFFGDAEDLLALLELSDEFGTGRIVTVQHRAARFIEPDPTYPLTTRAVRRMVASPPTTAAGCLDVAVALLLEGIDPEASLPVIRTERELVGLVDGSILEWRHHLAMVAASPWSPYARHLHDLAEQAGRPLVATVIEHFTASCRARLKEREREQVAAEVRRLVAESGVSQQRFARWVGTSPSRLSTYVSGSVTPSASLMLRMTRTSRLLQERDVQSTGPPEEPWVVPRAGETAPDQGGPGALDRRRSHLSAV